MTKDNFHLLNINTRQPEVHPATPFLKAYLAFDSLVQGCFSVGLCPDYKDRVKSFQAAYLECGVSVTPKVHAVFEHLGPFLEKHQVGLGRWSEQAFESVHAKFKLVWNKYSVKDKFNPKYSENLLKTVIDFNGNNVI